MDEEKKTTGCTGHCENCNMTQRCYCAAQISLYNQQEIAVMKENQDKIMKVLEMMATKKEELCTIHNRENDEDRVQIQDTEE